jgi:hypothetical protein
MALVFLGGSRCPICHDLIREKGSFFSTWGTFLPSSDPLWKYCDAPIHWTCYENWPERHRFAREYVDF